MMLPCPICGHDSHASCVDEVEQRTEKRIALEIIIELERMHPSMSAYDAAVDLRQSYNVPRDPAAP